MRRAAFRCFGERWSPGGQWHTVAGATKPNVQYAIPSGSSSSYVTVNGYSSQAAPETGVGAVIFKPITVGRKRRLRVSLGFDALFKGTAELILAPEKGGLVC